MFWTKSSWENGTRLGCKKKNCLQKCFGLTFPRKKVPNFGPQFLASRLDNFGPLSTSVFQHWIYDKFLPNYRCRSGYKKPWVCFCVCSKTNRPFCSEVLTCHTRPNQDWKNQLKEREREREKEGVPTKLASWSGLMAPLLYINVVIYNS